MTEAQHYEAVVIGAGQGGVPLARALAKAGRKTALVEREHVGGTCINEGCTPTKTMVASAKVAYFDRRSADYGVQNGPVSVDMPKVRQRKRDIVESFRSGNERRIEETEGLDLLMGEASFSGPKELEVHLNSNGEMDNNLLGFPKEPYGFGNDAKINLAPPAFADVVRRPLRLLLSGAAGSGARTIPDDAASAGLGNPEPANA